MQERHLRRTREKTQWADSQQGHDSQPQSSFLCASLTFWLAARRLCFCISPLHISHGLIFRLSFGSSRQSRHDPQRRRSARGCHSGVHGEHCCCARSGARASVCTTVNSVHSNSCGGVSSFLFFFVKFPPPLFKNVNKSRAKQKKQTRDCNTVTGRSQALEINGAFRIALCHCRRSWSEARRVTPTPIDFLRDFLFFLAESINHKTTATTEIDLCSPVGSVHCMEMKMCIPRRPRVRRTRGSIATGSAFTDFSSFFGEEEAADGGSGAAPVPQVTLPK